MGLNKQMGAGGGGDLSSSNLSRAPLLLHASLKNAKIKSACPACYIENEFSKFRKFRNECTEHVSHIGKLPKNS